MYDAHESVSSNLDELYREIDGLIWEGRFVSVDNILRRVDVEAESFTMLIGFLTVTLQVKDKLAERGSLLKKVHDRAMKEHRSNELLHGL